VPNSKSAETMRRREIANWLKKAKRKLAKDTFQLDYLANSFFSPKSRPLSITKDKIGYRLVSPMLRLSLS
jgi:hypothetical protein